MRAQHLSAAFGSDVKRVLHLTRGVIFIEVQRVEVKPFSFDLGAFGDLPPEPHEHVGDTVLEDPERVACTARKPINGGRDIHAILRESLGLFLFGDLL